MKSTIYKTLVFSSLVLVAISMTSCYGCKRRRWEKEKKQEEMLFKETSGKIEKFIADKLSEESSRTDKPEDWVYEALRGLQDKAEIKNSVIKNIPADLPLEKQILKEIKLLPEESPLHTYLVFLQWSLPKIKCRNDE